MENGTAAHSSGRQPITNNSSITSERITFASPVIANATSRYSSNAGK